MDCLSDEMLRILCMYAKFVCNASLCYSMIIIKNLGRRYLFLSFIGTMEHLHLLLTICKVMCSQGNPLLWLAVGTAFGLPTP